MAHCFFLISVGLAAGVSDGTQKLGSFGLPFPDPGPLVEECVPSLGLEEEELALELVVASLATLLTLGARVSRNRRGWSSYMMGGKGE